MNASLAVAPEAFALNRIRVSRDLRRACRLGGSDTLEAARLNLGVSLSGSKGGSEKRRWTPPGGVILIPLAAFLNFVESLLLICCRWLDDKFTFGPGPNLGTPPNPVKFRPTGGFGGLYLRLGGLIPEVGPLGFAASLNLGVICGRGFGVSWTGRGGGGGGGR